MRDAKYGSEMARITAIFLRQCHRVIFIFLLASLRGVPIFDIA